MRKAIILLCIVATTSSSPTLPWDSDHSQDHFALQLQRRHELPPISAVLMALQVESILPMPYDTPTAVPTSIDFKAGSSKSTSSKNPSPTVIPSIADSLTAAFSTASLTVPSLTTGSSPAASFTRTSLPAATFPYVGPGRLILPESLSLNAPSPSSQSSKPTTPPNRTDSSKALSPTMRHIVVVGGAIGIIIFLVACCFLVMDPCIWKACATSRKVRFPLARRQRFGSRPLPSWMRITSGPPPPEKSDEKKGLPTLSPYPYSTSDTPKSKFSMTTASDYSHCEDTFASDTSISSPGISNLPYNGHGYPPALTPPLPSYSAATNRIGRPETPPIRPPRPPTTDSPAAIPSIYYADVDDQGFYQHPNPIVLEPTSPIINNPPAMSTNNAQPPRHLNFLPPSHQFFSSHPLGVDALQRHNRSRSAPTLDTLSTSSRRLSGATVTSTQETVESATESESPSPQKARRARKSTSAVSWIRYSKFQQQHHLGLQRQQSNPDEQPVTPLCESPSKERNNVGSAY